MKTSTITVEEYEILKQRVTTLFKQLESSTDFSEKYEYSDGLRYLSAYLKSVNVLPEFKHEATSKFHR